jgi:hypothetical protein
MEGILRRLVRQRLAAEIDAEETSVVARVERQRRGRHASGYKIIFLLLSFPYQSGGRRDMSPAEDRPGLPAPKRIPYGLISLAEMVNFSLFGVCGIFAQLMFEVVSLDRAINDHGEGPLKVDDAEKRRVERWLDAIARTAEEFEWKAVHDRIAFFRSKLEKPIDKLMLRFEFGALQETVGKGIENQLVYRYPGPKVELILDWKKDWANTLRSFPSAEADILPAVDCWALGHSTAAVFHAMRVLEHELRALATDVGRNYDTQQWYNIINEIESEIKKIGNLPKSPGKNERLRFLAEAAKEFVHFKDAWPNYVSHARGRYDEYQARSILEHVRSFMNVLASELHE